MPSDPRAHQVAELLAQLAQLLTPAQISQEPSTPLVPSMPSQVLFTVDDAAQQLGIGKTKAYSLVMSGELQSVQIGRLRRVHLDSINEYAARLVAEQASHRTAA